MKSSIVSLVFLLPFFSNSQSLFQNTYGTLDAEERAFDMVVLDDHSVITFGDRYETSTFERTGYLLKVDEDGNEQWNRQLSSNEELYGTSICQLPNGNVFLAGYDYDVPNLQFGLMVAEYNESNGLPVYQKTHELNMNVEAKGVIPMSDNGAIVLCEAEDLIDSNSMLVKINSSGDTAWTKLIDLYSDDEFPASIVTVSDGVVISGSVGGTSDIFVAKFNFDGNLQWEQRHQTSETDLSGGLAVIPSGGFYLTGTSTDNTTGAYKMVGFKLDASGNEVWKNCYNLDHNKFDFGYGADVMPDGGAIFVGSGHKADTSNFRDLMLVRTDATGTPLWTNFYGNVLAETGYAVKVDGNRIVGCGKGDVSDSEDVLILSTDFDGNTMVGIGETESEANLSVYPNPFTDHLNISLPLQTTKPQAFNLTDLSGRRIHSGMLQSNTSLNLESIPSGTYFLSVSNMTTIVIVKL